MHHVIVTRVSLSLCALFAACILSFALLVNPPEMAGPSEEEAAAPEGAVMFETYCARCHGVSELAAGFSAANRDDRMAELSRFLESHGRANAEQDRAILEYLARQH